MNASVKTALFGALIGGLILAAIGVSASALMRAQDTAQAAGVVTTLAIDMDPKDGGGSYVNNDHTVGTIDPCIQVSAGAVVQFDVVVDAIPTGKDLKGFQYFMGFDAANLTWTAQNHVDPPTPNGVTIMRRVNVAPKSCSGLLGCLDTSEVVPEPPDSGIPASPGVHDVFVADSTSGTVVGSAHDPYGTAGGVLGRYSITVSAAAPAGLYGIGLNDSATYTTSLANNAAAKIWDLPGNGVDNDGDTAIDEDLMLDEASTPQRYGLIAVGATACPEGPPTADVGVTQALVDKEPDDPATGVCGGTLTDEIDVGHHEWICLQNTLTNVSGDTPVDVDLTKTGSAPVSPGGGEVSYHCDGTEDEISVDGTPVTTCVLSTVLEGSEIIVKHLDVPLAQGSPEQMEEEWDVHCTEPSTHAFTFTSEIGLSDPSGIDPVAGNDTDVDVYTVDCLADADLEVTSAAVDAPPSGIIDIAFPVTVNANVTNLGTYGPVNADVTFDLDLTGTDCTSPDGSKTVSGVGLGGPVSPSATWSVTCGTLTSETFGGSASIALSSGQPHIEDPVVGNNGPVTATTDSTNIVAASADVEVISWSIVDEDDLPNIGLQVLIEPGTVATIHTEQVIHNDGPDGPAPTDDDRTVADVASVCDVEPNLNSDSFNLEVGVNPPVNDTWTVSWIDVSKPPYWCDLTFDKLLTITDPGFADPDLTNNDGSVTVRMVLDSDGDGIPDDGDLSGSDTDTPCAPGESTFCDDNCEDDDNPGQEDMDDDGIGDVCDTDNDNDLIPDDWDGDTILDDPCTGGDTTDCDDNCRLIANPLQEDADSDGIGNVCELDVNCSGGGPNGADALAILQRILGRVGLDPTQCPAPNGDLYAPRASAYVAYDPAHPELVGNGRDALMILQCILGRHNIVCPED
jgi:hypothetical protein